MATTPIYFGELRVGTEFDYVKDDSDYTGIKTGPDSWTITRGQGRGGPASGWADGRRVIKSITIPPKKGPHQMFKDFLGSLKTYLNENRDLIFTVGLVLILDEYAFKGVFRTRLQNLVEGFLSKAEAKHGTAASAAIDTKVN